MDVEPVGAAQELGNVAPTELLQRRRVVRRALLLLLVSLLVRLAFWLGTADRGWPHAAAYQGDAPYWQKAVAGAFQPGDPQAVLPFRPPAMRCLLAAVWDGGDATAWLPRGLMVLLGALVAPLVYLLLRRGFAERLALLAGGICAFAGNLVLLGSGLHSEIPYLLLFLLTVPDFERLQQRPGAFAAVRLGLLHALACLFRADHALVVLLTLGWIGWRRAPGRGRTTLIAGATFLLALLPWHLVAWQQIDRFNRDAEPVLPLRGALPWDDDALAAMRAMPAFAQLPNFRFADATLRVRGATRVGAKDLAVLDEAYGCRPEPLPWPFVALYGPLNFFLGNAPESDGGFTQSPLDRPPPLAGGAARYPPRLVFPGDGQLVLEYPPHLHAIHHGYRLGLQWIAGNPGAATALVARKLWIGWQGAATGLGSCALPMGLSGLRRPVDIATAEGTLATAWRLLLLALALIGAVTVRRQPTAATWTIWVLAKVATIALFFGYARLGALCIPALALFWAVALDRLLLTRLGTPALRRLAFGLLAALLLLEGVRVFTATTPTLDGAPIGTAVEPPQFRRVHVQY